MSSSEELIKCPVCNDKFKNIFIHILKSKDNLHKKFIFNLNQNIINNINNKLTSEEVSDLLNVSKTYILKIWKKSNKFNIKKNNLKIESNKKSAKTRKGKFRINEEKINKICNYFNSSLSVAKISKLVDCDERTIIKIFKNKFGEKITKSRLNRIGNLCKYITSKKINNNIRKNIAKEFFNKVSLKDIGTKYKISPATVGVIWKEFFGIDSYNKRKKNISILLQKEKSNVKSSKNEILCYNLLKEKVQNIIHHDYSLCPPYEIDIIIPELKIAINWDGIYHRKEIFKKKILKITKQRDHFKNKVLISKGWRNIVVIDDGSFNPIFVNGIVNKILQLLNNNWIGKIELK